MEITIKVELGVSERCDELLDRFLELFEHGLVSRESMEKSVAAVRERLMLDIAASAEKVGPDIAATMPDSITAGAFTVSQSPTDKNRLDIRNSADPDAEDPAPPSKPGDAADLPAVVAVPPPVLSDKPLKLPSFAVWTDARIAYLTKAYPANVATAIMLDALNKMPGKPIPSVSAMQVQCSKLGIVRARPVAPAASDDEAPDADQPPVTATWIAAMRWAQQNGVDTRDGDDDTVLERVNFARRCRKLPLFHIPDEQDQAA